MDGVDAAGVVEVVTFLRFTAGATVVVIGPVLLSSRAPSVDRTLSGPSGSKSVRCQWLPPVTLSRSAYLPRWRLSYASEPLWMITVTHARVFISNKANQREEGRDEQWDGEHRVIAIIGKVVRLKYLIEDMVSRSTSRSKRSRETTLKCMLTAC